MVQRITPELLRKRSEHNEGDLSSLQEIALHQFDIEKIECLDLYCKDLRILLLQNNQISKIENVSKLKALEYLNLALNNIQTIEGLEFCEELRKLDLTVNFISDLLCVEHLKPNYHLKELYLVGNPCTQVEGYRAFVAASLPQLERLDGTPIDRSERLAAIQNLAEIRSRLVQMQSSTADEPKERVQDENGLNIEEKKRRFHTEMTAHTPEARLAAAKEVEEFHKQEPAKKNPYLEQTKRKPARERDMVTADGRVFQCNEGKWAFSFEETAKLVVLRVQLSKYLDNSLISVDVYSDYVRILVQGKMLQLLLPERVLPDCVLSEKSTVTGELAVTMLLETFREDSSGRVTLSKTSCSGSELVEDIRRAERDSAARHKSAKDASLEEKSTPNRENQKLKRLGMLDSASEIKSVSAIPTLNAPLDFIDDPDVPPLC